jgi:hypothetical protein
MGQKAVEAHLIRAGGKVFSRLVTWLAALLLLFPVGFIAPNASLGSSPKLRLGPATEGLVAAVEAALAAWSVTKLALGSAAKRFVTVTRRAAVKAALAARGTIGFFKTGIGGVAVRAIGARAREGKLSAAVGSAFL